MRLPDTKEVLWYLHTRQLFVPKEGISVKERQTKRTLEDKDGMYCISGAAKRTNTETEARRA